MKNHPERFKKQVALVEQAMDLYLPAEDCYPENIHKAMRYSVFAGGKRIRPALLLLAAEPFTESTSQAVPAACAVEFIHTYSLIHDDLPAMDDDAYRRGQPTCHKVYGEAIAILAGDALLTLAFEILSSRNPAAGPDPFSPAYALHVAPETRLRVIYEIARSSGVNGMIGGQVVDMESEGKNPGQEVIAYINQKKTGALIEASLRAGVLLGGGREEDLSRLGRFGSLLGEAFQLVDDLLDVQGDRDKMGKAGGMDAQREKATYVAAQGLQKTMDKRDELYRQAMLLLAPYGDAARALQEITGFVFYRDY